MQHISRKAENKLYKFVSTRRHKQWCTNSWQTGMRIILQTF